MSASTPSSGGATRPAAGSSALLGIAMGVGNVLSYLFVLVLTRTLSTAEFGAYSAVITLGIVLVIPAGAFQVIVARRWPDPALRTSGLRAAASTGLALTAATVIAAPAVDALFHLGGRSATVAMAFMLVPMTLTGSFQGMLLGSGRLARLSILYVVTAAARVVGAVVCRGVDANVTQVFAAMAAASAVAALYGWWACADLMAGTRSHSPSLLGEMARSNSTLAAFTALTNIDVVLVRHFLDPQTSGGYGLASTFARAMCWGTQFLALLIVPRIARADAGVIWRAAGLVALTGAGAAAFVAVDAELLVRLVGGDAYRGFGSLVVACLGLGTVWALAQLWLFSHMADDDTTLGLVAWLMVATELLVGWVWWHDSVEHVVVLAAGCAGVVVMTGMWRTRRHRVVALEDEQDLLVADRP